VGDARATTALIAGASGLVGGHLLRRLLAQRSYARIEILVRRALPLAHDRLIQRLVQFDRLGADTVAVHTDTLFCCLGTTIKQAGSQDAFRRVDHDYPLALAKLAKTAGVQRFVMVSALGADARSSLFYNRVKGETERDIAALGLHTAVFMRPSLLLGERTGRRPGEKVAAVLGRALAPLWIGALRKYRPIAADDVAAAMIYAATRDWRSGPVESDEIARLARTTEVTGTRCKDED
jgi:uncharacterized protein YbjT (DUF2867 family)